jgi:hypothetical protein
MILCVRAEKLALRCPICRCREGRGRGKRAVAFDQFFQFGHISAEIANIALSVIETFPSFGQELLQTLFHRASSFTREAVGLHIRF